MTFGRTCLLLADAAERQGARLEPVGPTDVIARLVHGSRAVLVAKTRSPFLTQLAQTLSNNKHVSRSRLSAAEIPVVPDVLVDDDERPAAALALLRDTGRVVVKPNWGNRARGVHLDVRDEAALLAACRRVRADDLDEEALVEPFVSGINVRVAVIGGRFCAAAIIERPVLVGDGESSPRVLVARLNADPRRGSWRNPSRASLDEIEVDDGVDDLLASHGIGVDDPLPAGRRVELAGEELETIDFTEALHPTWAAVAERACARLGVDVGGIDLRGEQAAFERAAPSAYAAGGPALLEVNVLPALHVHACPTRGSARDVFDAFVRYCLQLPGAPPPCADLPAW